MPILGGRVLFRMLLTMQQANPGKKPDISSMHSFICAFEHHSAERLSFPSEGKWRMTCRVLYLVLDIGVGA